MGLENMGGLAVHVILSKLAPSDVASFCCVSESFRVWASDDSLWTRFCSDELNLFSPLDPNGNPTASFKAAYRAWREGFAMYPWSLVTRAKSCWSKLKAWSAVNFPEVLPTLRRGASEDEIMRFEKSLKIKLPLPTRVLYRFCDGQELPDEDVSGSLPSSLLGIIGGYSVYDHLVNVFLLPLSQMVLETRDYMRLIGFSGRSYKYIVVAASATYSEKTFFLNCISGQLFVGTRNLVKDGEMLPCVPDALINSVHDPKGSQQQDAMLLWLEEHGRCLQDGIIGVRQERKFRSISLFPEKAPICSSAVTNGVKVRASAAFVPEFSKLQDESEKFMFAYSIRLSLSPDGCIINGMTFSSCQLYWRSWIIRANDLVVANPNGEAVIGKHVKRFPCDGPGNPFSPVKIRVPLHQGLLHQPLPFDTDKYPLLRPGEEEFVYESRTTLQASHGSIEGSFTFVPGRLADAKDGPFAVEVASFPLQLPEYIF